MDYRIRNASQSREPDNIVPTMPAIPISTDQREHGVMVDSMLIDRFEETNMGYEDDIYDNYARTTLTDRTPDTNKFEHEEPRGAVNQNSGMLQLRYNGHRGNADTVYRPELFLGFMGDGDRERRGINVDPDFKEVRKQHEARTRFTRFSKDDSNFVVDGVRAERREIADKQAMFKITRNRTRVFDSEIDGRVSGKNMFTGGVPPITQSNVCKQVIVQSYGDYVKDAALTPQRKAAVICDNIIRDTKEYRNSANDQDREFMRYTQTCKSGPLRMEHKVKHGLVSASADFKQETRTKSFKAAGILMKNICNARHNLVADNDSDLANSRNTVAIKTAPISRDISIVTQGIRHEGDFAAGDDTQSRRNAAPKKRAQQITRVVQDRHLPSMHYNNALFITRAAKRGDLREAANNVVSDASRQGDISDFHYGKAAKREKIGGFNANHDYDMDKGASRATYQYKASEKIIRDNKLLNTNVENFKTESDDSQMRKTAIHGDNMAIDNADIDIELYDNQSKERGGAKLGSKYTRRGHAQEDAREVMVFGK